MPPHLSYVEPYCGGAAVLFAKDPEGVSEVINDLNTDVVNFWRVLQDSKRFERFVRIAQATPIAQAEWQRAHEILADRESKSVRRAWAFFVLARQSLAGRSGQGGVFTPISRTRTRRGMNEQASAWLSAVAGLPEVHARLKRVAILCRDALDVIRELDAPGTMYYCDPPYLHSTRTDRKAYGVYEMPEPEHRELLKVLSGIKGKFLLSGYPSGLYTRYAERCGWQSVEFDRPNNAAHGKTKRRMTECVWANFELPREKGGAS